MSQEIEQLLKNQQLVKPSETLDMRVHAALGEHSVDEPSPILFSFVNRSIGSIAAAVLIGVAVFLATDPAMDSTTTTNQVPVAVEPGSKSSALIKPTPVKIQHTWTHAKPGELIISEDGTPMRRIRREVLEHKQWVDEQTQLRMEVMVPRVGEILVPATVD